MPIRQAGMLESRVSTWPRDHFCRSTIAPRPSRPTTWNEFLPISMPITAITLLSFSIMACSFHLAPPASLLADGRQEHGRTIPLAENDLAAAKQALATARENVVKLERARSAVVIKADLDRLENSLTAARSINSKLGAKRG